MDSLMPAFVAALLAQATDRTPWLAAILADRWRPGTVIAALAIVQGVMAALAGVAALWMRDMLVPEARSMLFGIALVAAAIGAAMPSRSPVDRLDGWRGGPFATALLGLSVLALGDRTQFIAFAASASAAHPALAIVGAALGSAVPGVIAATVGERAWCRLPLRSIGWCVSLLLALAGLSLAAGGLRLI